MGTDYLELARRAQRFTFERLGYLGGAPDCARAGYLSYLRSDTETEWSDQWYNATQLGADAALLLADPSFGRCTIDKAAVFMGRYWYAGGGGYLGRGYPDGSVVLEPDRYSDDNAHTGLMLLDAYEAIGDGRYLKLARAAADFLAGSELRDDTFGGGFWWNTNRGISPEGKPAISQGLAIQLFARLYGATGERIQRLRALRTDAWTDATLWDPSTELYRWSVSFEDCAARSGRQVVRRFFSYDQGIMIEAKLALYRHLTPDPRYLERARTVAAGLEDAFWRRPEGGFNLEQGVEQVYAIYASWLTPSLLALYTIDRAVHWLDLARRNVDALRAYLGAPDGGYYLAGLLQDGAWIVDRSRDTAANAGLQRALALLGHLRDPAE